MSNTLLNAATDGRAADPGEHYCINTRKSQLLSYRRGKNGSKSWKSEAFP
jgi:hypothetical protein